jgi:hypothetical protein
MEVAGHGDHRPHIRRDRTPHGSYILVLELMEQPRRGSERDGHDTERPPADRVKHDEAGAPTLTEGALVATVPLLVPFPG